jgi:hypothetical protein
MASRLKDLAGGLSGLFRSSPRSSSGAAQLRQLTVEEVLAALPADAPAELRETIQLNCCTHYYVAEGNCGSGGCGAGSCCYQVVSSCAPTHYSCIGFPCSHGNFSTGC